METTHILASFGNINPIIIIVVMVWSLIWKGLALWKSAELKQKHWFIAILILNTLGILEIIYLFLVARKYKVDIVEKIGH